MALLLSCFLSAFLEADLLHDVQLGLCSETKSDLSSGSATCQLTDFSDPLGLPLYSIINNTCPSGVVVVIRNNHFALSTVPSI